MQQLNKVELIGCVGSVHVQTFDTLRMARLCVATNYAYKDREGTYIIDTDWHQVVAWEGPKIACLDRIEKGSAVRVLGRIRYHRYTGTDGIERISAEILANEIELVDEDCLTAEDSKTL